MLCKAWFFDLHMQPLLYLFCTPQALPCVTAFTLWPLLLPRVQAKVKEKLRMRKSVRDTEAKFPTCLIRRAR